MKLLFDGWCLCIFIVGINASLVFADNSSCPTWYYFHNATKQCRCGNFLRCTSHHTAVIIEGYCATTGGGGEEGKYYIGTCQYSRTENATDRLHTMMPDPDILDDVMCGPYNRKGLLCGECKDGYGPVLNQYDVKCAKCSKYSLGYAAVFYIALKVIPTTLVFICMILFHLDVTSGPFFGYFMFWQLAGIIISKYIFIFIYIQKHSSSVQLGFLNAIITISQLVSLNFNFIPYCISESLKGMHIQMLNLISAIFPFLLVFLTCSLMTLHARNCRIVHILWKPFSIILNKTNITTGCTSNAVIHAFASFILLSYFTGYSAMANVWTNTLVKRICVSKVFYVLYYDPTIIWLSREHILYIVIAAIPFTIVTLIPSLLLIIYPTRLYSRYLSRFIGSRKRLAITAFTEALHKCFKDGLNGTKDYRASPGLMLIVLVFYILFKNFLGEFDPDSSIAAVVYLVLLTFIATYLKPCKTEMANFSLCFHSLLLVLQQIAYHLWLHALYVDTKWLMASFIILPYASHLLVLIWISYKIVCRLMRHFGGYHFTPNGCRMALIDFANAVKQLFNRRRGSYTPLL